jgi:hypothetical protein
MSLCGWVRIFVKYHLLRSVPQSHLGIRGNHSVLFIIIVQGCCFLPCALVSCITNQTNILLPNDIKRVREFILCFISSVPTFILLLFMEHTFDLHDFAHLLSYFTLELLLSLEEKENIKECYLFHRHYRAAGLHLVCLQPSRNKFNFSNIKIKLILPLFLSKRP